MSIGCRPTITSNINDTSSTQRAIGPGASKVCDRGIIPSVGSNPSEVFNPTSPHHADGSRTEPPVSVPTAHPASPAATATPEPLDDPPGVRAILRSQGFHGVPMCSLVPHPPMATSTVFVLPRRIPPAANRRRAIVAVPGEIRSLITLEPPVVILPSTSMMSFNANGMP